MLLNNLYTINNLKEQENDTYHAKIDINSEHPVFKGHFPGQPVMPGVCLTNAITDLVSLSFHQPYYLQSADFIKFINLVIPSQTPSVNTYIKILARDENILKIEAQVFSETTTFLKLKGVFGVKGLKVKV